MGITKVFRVQAYLIQVWHVPMPFAPRSSPLAVNRGTVKTSHHSNAILIFLYFLIYPPPILTLLSAQIVE